MEDLRGLNLCGHVVTFSIGNTTCDDSSLDVIEIVLFLGGYCWNYPLKRISITTHSVLVPWSTMSSMSST